MKKILIVGGTMGVGKTTACRLLKSMLPQSVFLDGDNCWDMNPFVVNDETKTMVMDNICYLLNNFIRCTEYENIIFCWVLHTQDIIHGIISRLNTSGCRVVTVSLVCSAEKLVERLCDDVKKEYASPM